MSKARKRPPVVMIHGGFCGPWSFDSFAEKFEAEGYQVQRPALRFHDMVEPPQALGTTGLADYAADLEEGLNALDMPPILIGHSLGGLLAQMLAAKRAVHAVVLLAPSAPWGVPPTTLFEIAAAQAMLLQVGFWNQILPPDADVAGRHSLDRFAPAEREKIFNRLVPESGRAMFQTMHWGLDMTRASEVDADKVSCPVLAIAGSDDRINPPGTVERIAALYKKRATYEKFPRMSHWLISEPGWEKVADRALAWLEKL
jgi:pimeloyl-ACP methyl ester carboxylesterase